MSYFNEFGVKWLLGEDLLRLTVSHLIFFCLFVVSTLWLAAGSSMKSADTVKQSVRNLLSLSIPSSLESVFLVGLLLTHYRYIQGY